MSLSPAPVLARFRLPAPRAVQALGNLGGFSGASLWRVGTAAGDFCLRAWPAGDPSPERLAWLHRLQRSARQAGLAFVPELLLTHDGDSFLAHQGRLWELAMWLPGRADLEDDPDPSRVEAVFRALAQLHHVWERQEATTGPCPAVERRLRALGEWQQRMASGWRPPQTPLDPLTPWVTRAWRLLPERMARVGGELALWTNRTLRLRPCLCDVWPGNVLLDGRRVTGLVDYGSVKVDHPAVDLARLLGGLPNREAVWGRAVAAYAAVRPLTADEDELARLLDRSGVVGAILTWLRWLYLEHRRLPQSSLVLSRLSFLIERLEGEG